MIWTQYDLEVNAARHCNYACAGCNHSSPVAARDFYDPAQLSKDLDILRRFLKVKLFFAQGGEPLLHPNIIRVIELIAESGMGQPGILTNGELLPRQPDAFWECLARTRSQLRISVYPDLDRETVKMAEEKCKAHGIEFTPREVTSFSKPFLINDGSSYHGCIWNRCLTVHNGWFYLCPQSAFYPKQHMGLDEHTDGIPLDGLTEDKLASFLNRKDPLTSCRICAGHRGVDTPWHQVRSRTQWMIEAVLPS